MAVHITSLIDSRPRQPGTMVSRRPLETWLPPLHACWPRRDSNRFQCQPRNSAFAHCALAAGRFDEHLTDLRNARRSDQQ